ncbi:MAG: hypothetical protein M1823_000453 [Watsoniomyces obsoletus]|nr:MAG: hypothetical protein M1823_000453 [Watsoniomyces obsoletus]
MPWTVAWADGEDEASEPVLPFLTPPRRWPILPDRTSDIIRQNTVTITESHRIYSVVQAQRSKGFQQLVDKYVDQLLDGCHDPSCTTSTCFTYRQRVSRGPVRRLTTLSARTVACSLASRDDPKAALCPHGPQSSEARTVPASDPTKASTPPSWRQQRRGASEEIERRLRKDSKSITQNLFDTSAVKQFVESSRLIIDHSIQHLSSEWLVKSNSVPLAARHSDRPANERPSTQSGSNLPRTKSRPGVDNRSSEGVELSLRTSDLSSSIETQTLTQTVSSTPLSNSRRRHSITVRTGPRQPSQERLSTARRHTAGTVKPSKTSIPSVPPPLDVPTLIKDDEERRPIANGQRHRSDEPVGAQSTKYFGRDDHPSGPLVSSATGTKSTTSRSHHRIDEGGKTSLRRNTGHHGDAPDTPSSSASAQSLSHFSLDIVRAVDQLLTSADGLSVEQRRLYKYFERDSMQDHFGFSVGSRSDLLQRAALHSFVDQSVYYILSGPETLLASFHDPTVDPTGRTADDGGLPLNPLKTHEAFRMLLDIRHNLVLHSLWQGIEALFVPPPQLVRSRKLRNRVLAASSVSCSTRGTSSRPSWAPGRYLADMEAAQIVSLAFHALFAAVPAIRAYLGESMTEVRSDGKVGFDDRTPHFLIRQVGDVMRGVDAFENELALRLASRLVRAVATRLYYSELLPATTTDTEGSASTSKVSANFASILCAYLADCHPGPATLGDFDPDAHLPTTPRHRKPWTMPSVMVEWVRTVLVKSWDGKEEVSRFGEAGSALRVLELFYERREDLGLSADVFHTPYLASKLDPLEMPVEWYSSKVMSKSAHLLSYPFLFVPSMLVTYFRAINFSNMMRAFETSLTHLRLMINFHMLDPAVRSEQQLPHRLRNTISIYLLLAVRREHLLTDAFDQLWRRERRELLRPLKVVIGKAEGEQGQDLGGIQQEFFRIALNQALDPDHGFFSTDPETGLSWFLPGSVEPLYKYELIGLLFSLAIYNGAMLPVSFPQAMYRKLLGLPVTTVSHIEDGWPLLAKGFTDLLEWSDGRVEDVFMRTYEFSYETFGRRVDIDMQRVGRDATWPTRDSEAADYPPLLHSDDGRSSRHGEATGDANSSRPGEPGRVTFDISEDLDASQQLADLHASGSGMSTSTEGEAGLVTNENREQYVADYIFWLTDKSIRPQYEAFVRGFFSCCGPKTLSLFEPDALRTLVEGQPVIDTRVLQETARYEDGYSATHPCIRNFWSIVHRYSDEQKRHLWQFITARDRVPVRGTNNVSFTIMRLGPDSDRLPSSSTCFARLLLPEYATKKKLREKLNMALENGRVGFYLQ